jgi:hypothetical protein
VINRRQSAIFKALSTQSNTSCRRSFGCFRGRPDELGTARRRVASSICWAKRNLTLTPILSDHKITDLAALLPWHWRLARIDRAA